MLNDKSTLQAATRSSVISSSILLFSLTSLIVSFPSIYRSFHAKKCASLSLTKPGEMFC